MRRVKDFLPSPEELMKARTNIKVTLSLAEGTVKFFKEKAEKENCSYLQLIRNALDKYVEIVERRS